jgi:hypothetical protein
MRRFALPLAACIGVLLLFVSQVPRLSRWLMESQLPAEFPFQMEQAGLENSIARAKGLVQARPVGNFGIGFDVDFPLASGEKLTLPLSKVSVFTIDGQTLFVARPRYTGMGCLLEAYALTDGSMLWSRQLCGIGPGMWCHSFYSNEVNLEVTPWTVTVIGRESFADYLEVSSRIDGRLLAHRHYRGGHPLNR